MSVERLERLLQCRISQVENRYQYTPQVPLLGRQSEPDNETLVWSLEEQEGVRAIAARPPP